MEQPARHVEAASFLNSKLGDLPHRLSVIKKDLPHRMDVS